MTLSPPLASHIPSLGKGGKGGNRAWRGAARDFMKSSQLGKAFPSLLRNEEVYDLLNPTDLVVFDQFQRRCPMPKLSQYASYMALIAALFVGFAVTMHVGMSF